MKGLIHSLHVLIGLAAVAAAADVDSSGLNAAPALSTQCSKTLTQELTQGPYYLDDILFRSDITEGQAGVPLKLQIYLLDTACNPVEDAFISIWHANATGVYSGFTGTATSGGVAAGQTDDLTFMRGIVMTDREGLATFETVYPGTYSGRTPHIHVKAFVPTHNLTTTNETAMYVDSHLVHTGQFFNTDLMNAYVREIRPYSTNLKPTLLTLAEDHVYSSDSAADAERQILSFREVTAGNASAGLIATINAIVDRNATYSNVFSAENDMGAVPSSVHDPNSGAIKATAVIAGLMVFSVAAALVAMKTGFADKLKERFQQQRYQTMGDSHVNRPVNSLQLS